MVELMTLGEVAAYLRVNSKTIYRLLKAGKLPANKIGRQWRFDRGAIDEWLQLKSLRVNAGVLDDVPIVMFLVNRGKRVQVANRAMVEFIGRSKEEMIGLRGGEALRCLHAQDNPRGCGFGPSCEKCLLDNTVSATLETGKGHYRVAADGSFERWGKREELTFLLSTIPSSFGDGGMVLVSLEDIAKRQAANEVLLAKASVLVIDDNDAIQMLFRDVLEEYGYRVTLAKAGSEALELVRRRAFDMVFLDLKLLGKMDGAELFGQIKAIKPWLPVTITTGYPDSEMMTRALAQGPCGVMKKPFHESDVFAAVEKFLRSAARRKPP